jgi:hypothetical protein
MMGFLASVWGKAMMGAVVVLFIAAAFFCNRWVSAREDLADALDATAKAEAEITRTRAALDAAEARARDRAAQTATQRQDEETIRDVPETNNCGASPAIGRALDILRQRRTNNSPASGSPSVPPELR